MKDQIFNTSSKKWTNLEVGRMKYLLGPEFTRSTALRIFRLDPGDSFSSHEHEFIQCMYFLTGEGEVSLDDRVEKVVPGLTVIVLPKQSHSVTNRGSQIMEIIVCESFDLHQSETPFIDF